MTNSFIIIISSLVFVPSLILKYIYMKIPINWKQDRVFEKKSKERKIETLQQQLPYQENSKNSLVVMIYLSDEIQRMKTFSFSNTLKWRFR